MIPALTRTAGHFNNKLIDFVVPSGVSVIFSSNHKFLILNIYDLVAKILIPV